MGLNPSSVGCLCQTRAAHRQANLWVGVGVHPGSQWRRQYKGTVSSQEVRASCPWAEARFLECLSGPQWCSVCWGWVWVGALILLIPWVRGSFETALQHSGCPGPLSWSECVSQPFRGTAELQDGAGTICEVSSKE